MEIPARGHCQCGQCAYSLSAPGYVTYTCHCAACQKMTATAFLTCMQAPAESVEITRGAPVTRKRTTDTGNVLETWFCPTCGSTLFAQNSARPRVRTVHVGSLEHPEQAEVSAHIWVKRKLPWIELPAAHRIFEEAGDWTTDYAQDPSRYQP